MRRDNKLWADDTTHQAPKIIGGTIILVGTMFWTGPENALVAVAAKYGYRVLTTAGRKVLAKLVGKELVQLTEAEAKIAIAEAQCAARSGMISSISQNKRLIKEAEKAAQSVQASLDHLAQELAKGHMNPGIGTKPLFGDIYYARARDGARLFFRKHGNIIEIIAKASKENEEQVINILRNLYPEK
jgi:hypothetical protein